MDHEPVIRLERRANVSHIEAQLAFTKNLNSVISNIHDHVISKIDTAYDFDEIMLEVSKDICTIFNADRITIYSLDKDKTTLISKIKTGANSFRDLKLRITEQSLAGYVALNKKYLTSRMYTMRTSSLRIVSIYASCKT